MEARCDYLILGILLFKEEKFGLNDTILKMAAEKYETLPNYELLTIYGDNWPLNSVTLIDDTIKQFKNVNQLEVIVFILLILNLL